MGRHRPFRGPFERVQSFNRRQVVDKSPNDSTANLEGLRVGWISGSQHLSVETVVRLHCSHVVEVREVETNFEQLFVDRAAAEEVEHVDE